MTFSEMNSIDIDTYIYFGVRAAIYEKISRADFPHDPQIKFKCSRVSGA